jgi:hypothetical protein
MDMKGGCSPQNETNVANNDLAVEGFLKNLCEKLTVGVSPYGRRNISGLEIRWTILRDAAEGMQ